MKFRHKLGQFLRPWSKRASLENPTTPINNPDRWLYEALGGHTVLSGEFVNTDNAIGESAVGECIRILAGDVSILPLNLYFDDGESKTMARNHPLYRVLRWQANEAQTASEWRALTQYHLGGWGAAYSYIVRDDRGIPVELLPLLPDVTWPERKNGKLQFVTQVERDGPDVVLQANQVLYLHWFTYDGVTPLSPVGVDRERIGRAIATSRYGSRFFARGGDLKGVLETPNKVADPARLRENWESVYGGNQNQFRTAVLEEGMSYKPISVNPRDAQFIDAMGYNTSEIANLYRMPELFLNRNDRSTWANARELIRHYHKQVLREWLNKYEQRMTMQLLGRTAQLNMSIRFDQSDVLRGDPLEEAQRDTAYLTNGVMSPNEVRSRLGLNPRDGGDEFYEPVAQAQAPADEEPDDTPAPQEEDDEQARLLKLAQVERVVRGTEKLKDPNSYRIDRHMEWIVEVLKIDTGTAAEFLAHVVRDEQGHFRVKATGKDMLLQAVGYD